MLSPNRRPRPTKPQAGWQPDFFALNAKFIRTIAIIWLMLGINTGVAYGYEVRFDGELPEGLQEKIQTHSVLWAQRAQSDTPEHQLRYRLRKDQAKLTQLLHSEGYYDGTVTGQVEPNAVTLNILAGALYHLAPPVLEYSGAAELAAQPTLDQIKLNSGIPATAKNVLEAKGRLIDLLKQTGFLAAKIDCESLVVDHAVHLLQVKWCIDSGPQYAFAGLAFQGLTDVSEQHARANINLQPGEILSPAKTAQIVQDLIATGLFRRVVVSETVQAVTEGTAQTILAIEVIEAPHRSFMAGLSYETNRGAGLHMGWEHRNFWHNGEKLFVDTKLAEDHQQALVGFVKPHFTHPRRTLRIKGGLEQEQTDAYQIQKITAQAELDQRFTKNLTATAGVEIDTTREDLGMGHERFSLLTPFIAAAYDKRDSLLNPTSGYLLSAKVAPSFGIIDTQDMFTTLQIAGRTYWDPQFASGLLAVRMKLSTIVGGSRQQIPADRLLYAGGGGSVRGFAFQSIGPMDNLGTPLGGRSLLEASAEWRQPVHDDFDIVGFVDTGLIGPARLPQTDDRLEVGAGLGVRYHTAVGPLRFDIALPVTRRDGDDPFQIYISIGQAF